MKIMNGNTVERIIKLSSLVATARVKKHFVVIIIKRLRKFIFLLHTHRASHRVAQQRVSLFCGTASPRDSHDDFRTAVREIEDC